MCVCVCSICYNVSCWTQCFRALCGTLTGQTCQNTMAGAIASHNHRQQQSSATTRVTNTRSHKRRIVAERRTRRQNARTPERHTHTVTQTRRRYHWKMLKQYLSLNRKIEPSACFVLVTDTASVDRPPLRPILPPLPRGNGRIVGHTRAKAGALQTHTLTRARIARYSKCCLPEWRLSGA